MIRKPKGDYVLKLMCFLLFAVANSYASIISIPLDNSEYELQPAEDLVYQGQRISSLEAMELEEQGQDLSLLNPYNSSLYQENSRELKKLNVESGDVIFHSTLKSPTEYYRASVNINGKNYTISASLYNHQTLMRAALLNLIGYQSIIPEYREVLRLNFDSVEQKEQFKTSLGQATLLAKKRWIKNIESDDDSKLYLDLSGVLIEPADLEAVPVYWPIMEASRQSKRRIFRSLSYLYTLTDFPQQINRIGWDFGKIFNGKLILDHAYGQAFNAVTMNDFKWIHQKISNLSEREIWNAVIEAQYPRSISELVFEKLKSRINSISKLVGQNENLRVNKNLTIPFVENGKLLSFEDDRYVPIFWEEDPLSPYRFSEIFKLFRSQITYDSMSEVLEKGVQRFLPSISSGDAFEEIRGQIGDYVHKEGFVPLKLWSFPTYQGSVAGNRSIVFGQYLGNNAPIQLVDNIQYRMSVGLFSYLSGVGSVGQITPTANLKASLVRSYSHVRAMPDLSTATNQSLKKLFVPGLLKKLGKVLKDNIECSVTEKAWYAEEIVSTFRTWVVYYDKTDGKDAAIKLREKLIAEGVDEGAILLSPVSQEEICEREISDTRTKNIEEFIKEFALDETLTISDSLSLGGELGVKADLGGIDQLRAQIAVGREKALLRSYSIRKVSGGIEVTLQTQNNLSTYLEEGLKFYIDIMTNTTEWLHGKMISKVYKIPLENISEKEQIAAIDTLREIFLRNSFSNLKYYYNPVDLDHTANVRLNTFRFFWKKTERLFMNQEVKIEIPKTATNIEEEVEEESSVWTPPVPEIGEDAADSSTRTVFSAMSFKRSGSNYHNFLDRLLNNRWSWLRIGSTDRDPGNSIYGSSKKRYYTTETELTADRPENTTLKVEYAHTGWSASPSTIESMLQEHESYLRFPGVNFSIDRGLFAQTTELRSYDIRTTIILYPSAIDKIKNIVTKSSTVEFLTMLKRIYGAKDWDRYCKRMISSRGERGSHILRDGRDSYCLPHKFSGLVERRNFGFSEDRKIKTNQIHYMFGVLFEGHDKSKVLAEIGQENFFASTYIGGYRNGDVEGYLVYTSDTVGTYQTDYGTGLFDSISAKLGLTPYLIRGMAYTPNM